MCRIICQWSMSALAFIRRRWPVWYTHKTNKWHILFDLWFWGRVWLGMCVLVCVYDMSRRVSISMCVFSMSAGFNVRSDKPHRFACNIVASLLLRLKRLQGGCLWIYKQRDMTGEREHDVHESHFIQYELRRCGLIWNKYCISQPMLYHDIV